MTIRSFAIIPAAGRSVRMGTPKLLLPWRGKTLIEEVLSRWRASEVSQVTVVVHPEDLRLADLCRPLADEVIVAVAPPPDMKASVQLALAAIGEQFHPQAGDAWLVAPADIPELSPTVVDSLLAAHERNVRASASDPAAALPILVPAHQGRRGHPVLFPWSLAPAAMTLPADKGINHLLVDHAVCEVAASQEALAGDVDTPDDYDNAHGSE